MKRRLVSILAVMIMIVNSLTGCGSSGSGMGSKEIILNEAAHTVFYAPLYVALNKGFFKEEGLKVNLVNGLGSDKTITALLKGKSDIGLLGPETTIYLYNAQEKDYVVNFAQLTQRAGDYLVSRDNNESFHWNNIKGKTVLGGRSAGMPEMVFEYILNKNGIDPKKDLTIVRNINYGLTSQEFTSGKADYMLEFEPDATELDLKGTGKVVAALGEESGKVPYTAFSARKSYIEANPEIIKSFTKAIQKGLDYVLNHTPEEIAKVIQPQFAETDSDTLIKIVTGYYERNTWKENLIFEEGSLKLLEDIMEETGNLTTRVPYQIIVNSEFADKVAK